MKEKNKVVFDVVFSYYYSGLCAFANRYLYSHAATEDLVQDFFVELWIESHRLEIKSSLKSYLFTSIRNRCFDWHKHQKAAEKYRKMVLSKGEVSEIPLDEMLAETELRNSIQKALIKLSPRCREIFTLSRIKGLSNKQIAEHLGLSKRTIELQISNSLKILRTELTYYLPLWIIVALFG